MKRKYTDDEFRKAIKESTSTRQTLIKLGLAPKGGNYQTIKRGIKRLELDTSHHTGMGHLRNKHHDWAKKIPLSELLINSEKYYGTYKLKKRLIKDNFFEEKCYNCELTEWLNRKIPLELEHKNGISTDNRIENLTLLCPNCHALTTTYRGKNKK